MSDSAVKFEYKPENKVVTVVLLGNFNPVMFQPHWFGLNQIISQSEVDAIVGNTASPFIVAPNITIFNTSQLQVQVQENKFSVVGLKESFTIVKDVVKKTFERLGSMPIIAMGINASSHFRMPDLKTYQKFGDMLTPKEGIWEDLLGDNISGDERTGGLSGLQMTNYKKDKEGMFNVIVERSVRFNPGIFISCNDHYQFDVNTDAETAMLKLEENFDSSLEKSFNIQTSLFKNL